MQQESSTTSPENKFQAVLILISRWMAIFACIVLAVMMLFVTIDVAGRNIFNWPLRGTVEVVGLLLIIASTWGLGLCQIEKKHLRILLFYDMFPRKVQLLLDLFAYLVCLAAAGLVAWQTLLMAKKFFQMPMGNVTEILELPQSPFMLALAWGFGWMCVVLLADVIKTFREIGKR
jgi:TRAP-type C4-dicarboxylate transport system permease small subunit